MRVDDQFRQWCSGLGRAEPTKSINETDSFDGHLLLLGGFEHDESNQVVDECVHRQLLEDAFDGEAMQHFHFHRRFEVTKIGFDAPALTVEFGDLLGGIASGIEQRGDDGDGLGSATGLFDLEAKLAHDEGVGEGIVFVLVHPIGLRFGFDIFDELVVLAKTFEPA